MDDRTNAPVDFNTLATANDAGAVQGEARCVVCSYQLRGLGIDGRCPECGTPVSRSLQGNMLRFSSPAYLKALHQGVFLILATIVAQILLIFIGIGGAGIAAAIGAGVGGAAGSLPNVLMNAVQFVDAAASLALAFGWWLFSTPDPAIIGVNTGATARHVVRVTVCINAIVVIVNSLVVVAFPNLGSMPVLVIAFGLVALIAWVVQFFASMRYVQWLAPRLPNEKVLKRARIMMWLGPVLYTVGALACGIGPLVALVMYWNMLDWVRRDIKEIRRGQPAELVGCGASPPS